MASLQDQLLKAGLTTKQKTRQANSDKRKKNKQKRSGVAVDASLQEQVKKELELAKQEKLARDTALNDEKKVALAVKEQQLRVSQILQHHQITNVKGEAEYNYTFNSKIKKLFIDNVTHKALVNGQLALCGVDEQTYIVTAETAEKVASLDKNVILVQNTKVKAAASEEDDPYAEFQIPDDLMW
jgi:uncharacterized protein YaiL (DUF2058 family)